ncbi:MAG TPA: S-methyl-5-thioribose-1-phosphate isomerase, partial [Anaerolineae bacterium]|nr:S-methyl-5-thioribose-1-phosphate isomerase [Anaerolineae bacterium]
MELQRTIEWQDNQVLMVDQRVLPLHYEIKAYSDYRDVAEAIRSMVIRGAPAIGAAAAFGLALAGLNSSAQTQSDLQRDLAVAADVLRQSRPTAVNLFWAIDRMLRTATAGTPGSADDLRAALIREAQQLADEDVAINRRMAEHGAVLIKDGDTILTHCNTGALAVVDYGTALGVIRRAHEQGKRIKVFADETRPRLQGARLTAWELMRWGIDVTLIADNAAGHYMRKGFINICFVGSDRTAANGDVA